MWHKFSYTNELVGMYNRKFTSRFFYTFCWRKKTYFFFLTTPFSLMYMSKKSQTTVDTPKSAKPEPIFRMVFFKLNLPPRPSTVRMNWKKKLTKKNQLIWIYIISFRNKEKPFNEYIYICNVTHNQLFFFDDN